MYEAVKCERFGIPSALSRRAVCQTENARVRIRAFAKTDGYQAR